jgi:DNA-binding MarR family transcriptional regulator
MARKHNAKGRSRWEGRYVALPIAFMRSAAWESLTPVERCTYIEAASTYDGFNNGYLAVPARRVAERLHIGKSTAARALRVLVQKGFLEVTRERA